MNQKDMFGIALLFLLLFLIMRPTIEGNTLMGTINRKISSSNILRGQVPIQHSR